MGVRLRSWWHFKTVLVVVIILVVVILLIIIGYRFDWTGFNGNNKSGKTLWDWMQLLFIPVVLAVAGFWFNHRERKAAELRSENERKAAELRAEAEREIERQRAKTESDIAEDNQREAALQEYIDKMSELLLHEKLRESKPEDEVRTIARVLTLTVVRRCDAERKGSVLLFLQESGLIEKGKSIIHLNGADLSEAGLFEANLSGANLSEADLSIANLRGADLSGANLFGAYMSEAKLFRANLRKADLSGADLDGADLMGANLMGANLSEANLMGANLMGAELLEANLMGAELLEANLHEVTITLEQLDKAKSLQGATMPDGSKHS